jgi:hypothetical protein
VHDDSSDRSITSGHHSINVELADRHWVEDNIGGWANDPRPLYLRIAEIVAANVIPFAAVAIMLLVATKALD